MSDNCATCRSLKLLDEAADTSDPLVKALAGIGLAILALKEPAPDAEAVARAAVTFIHEPSQHGAFDGLLDAVRRYVSQSGHPA